MRDECGTGWVRIRHAMLALLGLGLLGSAARAAEDSAALVCGEAAMLPGM